MEKIGNDTFKYNGKLYKVVKKEIGHRCNDTCPLYNYRSCGNICSVMYNQLKNPGFTYEDVVLVEVPENENKETNMEEKEPNYKALYEQEHKKYGDAVERMKSWMNGEHPECFSEAQKAAEFVFPELKESEDERIKRAILEFFESQDENTTYSFVHRNDIIAWLRKQKESKRIEQEQTELPKGEDYAIDGLWQAIQILEHSLGEVDGWQSDDGILEHKCAIEAVKRLYEQKATWSEDDEETLNNILNDLSQNVIPDDEDTQWLKSLKDRITITNKNDFDRGYDVGISAAKFNQWRPTEEQMEALSDAVKLYKSTHFDSHHYKIETLYEDLKKL